MMASDNDAEPDESFEAESAEVGAAQDVGDAGGLIMAEFADSALIDRLDERESAIGERKEMGPPLDFNDEPRADNSSASLDVDESTPPQLEENE